MTEVSVFHQGGDLLETSLRVDGKALLLMAGELHETWTEEFDWAWGDESVLVFTDPAAADVVPWRCGRDPGEPITS